MAVDIHKPEGNQFLKMLVHAPSGAGKTFFMGTAQLDERTSPMLVLDFEGGYGTLAGLDIDIAPIRSWDDYSEVYTHLLNGTTDDNGVDYSQYKSLGVDSISETHIFALLEILRVNGPSRKDGDLIEQGDYGKASVQMRRLLREFRDLPLHVIFTAQSKEIEESRVGKVKVPALSGQLAEEVPGMMDVVGYLARGEDDEGVEFREMLLQGYPKFRSKIRVPWEVEAPDSIEDPTVTKVLDVLGIEAPKAPRSRKK